MIEQILSILFKLFGHLHNVGHVKPCFHFSFFPPENGAAFFSRLQRVTTDLIIIIQLPPVSTN